MVAKYINFIDCLQSTRSGRAWNADITYIILALLFIYLVVLMDRFNRRSLGYALVKPLIVDMVKAALPDVLSGRSKGSLIHHSDQGI